MRSAISWNSGKYEPQPVLDDEALESAVVGLAHGGVHADLGRDAADEQALDLRVAQDRLESVA